MPTMKTMRVLIADRDEDLLETYEQFFTSHGVETSLVTSGVDCVARLRNSRPDVLVLEPGLLWGGGDGVLERMYGERGLPVVPVILLANGRRADQLYRALEFPIDEFLLKPIRPQALLKKIRELHCDSASNTAFKLAWSRPAPACQGNGKPVIRK